MKFELLNTDGRASRAAVPEPRRRRDADLHAGRHLRRHVKAMTPQHLFDIGARSSSATPFTCGCVGRPRSSISSAGCTISWAGAGPILTDWRLSRWVARRAAQNHRGGRFASPINGDRLFLSPEVSMQIPALAEFRHRDAARRVHRRCHLRAGAGLDADEPAGRSGRIQQTLQNPTRYSASQTLFEQLRADSWPGLNGSASTASPWARAFGWRIEGHAPHPRFHRAQTPADKPHT